MKQMFLFPEMTAHTSGFGPAVDLGDAAGQLIVLTLDITCIQEQQTLDAVIWGSTNGTDWGPRPIFSLPHRYYCGTYHHHIDLSNYKELRFLRLEYRLRGWLPQSHKPVAIFSAHAELCPEEALTATA